MKNYTESLWIQLHFSACFVIFFTKSSKASNVWKLYNHSCHIVTYVKWNKSHFDCVYMNFLASFLQIVLIFKIIYSKIHWINQISWILFQILLFDIINETVVTFFLMNNDTKKKILCWIVNSCWCINIFKSILNYTKLPKI